MKHNGFKLVEFVFLSFYYDKNLHEKTNGLSQHINEAKWELEFSLVIT